MFEKESKLGGKLVYNIPKGKLPQKILIEEIRRIKSLDIKINVNIKIDLRNILKMKDNYDTIIIAIGVQKPKDLGFPGEKYAINSYDFLRQIKLEIEYRSNLIGKDIVIIGAGNVAMDVAFEAHNCGAKNITAVDIKAPSAFCNELRKAESLGTEIIFPRFIDRYDGNFVYFKNDDPKKADVLIKSVGEEPEIDYSELGILINGRNFTTNIPGLYIIGDALSPGLVANAIGSGKKVAEHIHSNFQKIKKVENDIPIVDKRRINLVYFQKKNSFFDDLIGKCASCGTCIQCDICVENCPHNAISRIGEDFKINLEKCAGCGTCASLCPRGAITMVKKLELFQEESSEGTKIKTQAYSFNY